MARANKTGAGKPPKTPQKNRNMESNESTQPEAMQPTSTEQWEASPAPAAAPSELPTGHVLIVVLDADGKETNEEFTAPARSVVAPRGPYSNTARFKVKKKA